MKGLFVSVSSYSTEPRPTEPRPAEQRSTEQRSTEQRSTDPRRGQVGRYVESVAGFNKLRPCCYRQRGSKTTSHYSRCRKRAAADSKTESRRAQATCQPRAAKVGRSRDRSAEIYLWTRRDSGLRPWHAAAQARRRTGQSPGDDRNGSTLLSGFMHSARSSHGVSVVRHGPAQRS